MRFARDLWAGLSLPSPADQDAEAALIRGLAHVVLGAALALLAPWWAAALAYAAAKELPDLRRGGGRLDGGFDVAFVAIGGAGFAGWPVAAIALGLAHGFIIWKRGRT